MRGLGGIHHDQREWGNIIVTLLVAVSIVTIVSVAINRLMVAGDAFHKKARDKLDLAGIRTYILEKIDCQKTLPKDFMVSCEQQKFLDIVGKDGKPIVAAAGELGSAIGTFAVRAYCSNQKHKLSVETRSLPILGTAAGDQVESWQDLFQGVRLCGLMYPEGEDSSIEQRYNASYLEFYPTGNFRAGGGGLIVNIEKIYGNSICQHRITGGDAQIQDRGFFFLDRHGLLRLKAVILGCNGRNSTQSLDLTDPQVTLIKQGQNIWRIEIADSMKTGGLRAGRTIWQLTAQPKSH